MDSRSMPHWVTSVALVLLMLFTTCCSARSISIEGTAKFLEDGQQIKSGTVILYEYLGGGPGRMPDVRPLTVLVTDRDGKFHTELADVHGPLDVHLVRDHCDWTAASTMVSAND